MKSATPSSVRWISFHFRFIFCTKKFQNINENSTIIRINLSDKANNEMKLFCLAKFCYAWSAQVWIRKMIQKQKTNNKNIMQWINERVPNIYLRYIPFIDIYLTTFERWISDTFTHFTFVITKEKKLNKNIKKREETPNKRIHKTFSSVSHTSRFLFLLNACHSTISATMKIEKERKKFFFFLFFSKLSS